MSTDWRYLAVGGVGAVLLYMALNNSANKGISPCPCSQTFTERQNTSAPSDLSAGGQMLNLRGAVRSSMRFSNDPTLQKLSDYPPGIALYPIADHISAVQWAAIGGTDRRIPITTENLNKIDMF